MPYKIKRFPEMTDENYLNREKGKYGPTPKIKRVDPNALSSTPKIKRIKPDRMPGTDAYKKRRKKEVDEQWERMVRAHKKRTGKKFVRPPKVAPKPKVKPKLDKRKYKRI